MSKKVILVTGASSGFGALTVRAIADAKHIVYAGMRDNRGRNADTAGAARTYADAGHMVLGPTEAFTPERVASVYDTNVLVHPGFSSASGWFDRRVELMSASMNVGGDRRPDGAGSDDRDP
jgi:hypothetical protein